MTGRHEVDNNDDQPNLEPRNAAYNSDSDSDDEDPLLLTQPGQDEEPPHPQEQGETDEGRPTRGVGDRKLMEVYGDHVHQNDGAHLDGGIADDAVW